MVGLPLPPVLNLNSVSNSHPLGEPIFLTEPFLAIC